MRRIPLLALRVGGTIEILIAFVERLLEALFHG